MRLDQEWLDRRMRPLKPSDFDDGVRFYSAAGLTPPPEFAAMWGQFGGADATLSEDDVANVNSILILSNPFDQAEHEILCQLVTAADSLGHSAPPMFWIPHTTAPEVRAPEAAIDVTRDKFVESAMELGLDGIIAGEPEGFRLALAVRAKTRKSASLSKTLNDIVNERRARAQQSEFSRDCIHCIMWDYLRLRLAPIIPAIDFNLPAGPLQRVGNFSFGELLGEGMYGTVFVLTPDDPAVPVPQVAKVVDKSGITELQDLKSMKRMIEVMRLLSSDQFAHPHVIKLHEVYHSPTHILFRMEYGGPENLYRRLSYRQKSGAKCRPLSYEKTLSLIKQALDVVSFIHLVPHVCHRDIKPENFIVDDTTDHLSLKLADFDLAVQFEPTTRFKNPCGTVTFTAPEVILDREYNGAAADIWSLGIVLLEVMCHVRVLEQRFGLQMQPGQGDNRPNETIATKIRGGFQTAGSVEKMLQELCRPDLQALLPSMLPLMGGIIVTALDNRWDAQQVKDHLPELPEA